METIEIAQLTCVTGGKKTIEDIKRDARPYCPGTVDKYSKIDPNKIDRPMAEQMGNECLAEINPFFRGVARGRIQAGIDEAFPK